MTLELGNGGNPLVPVRTGVYGPSLPGALQAPLLDQGGQVYNVKAYGAKGDGTTNENAAFATLGAIVTAAVRINPGTGESANKLGTTVIELPPGSYLITQTNQLIPSPGTRTKGLLIRGAGRGQTQVIFKPTDLVNHEYLFRNEETSPTQNGWLGIKFEGISFLCDTTGASFMYSKSDGGPQNYFFEHCDWKDFTYGWRLKGTNNNDSFTWLHCGFSGDWTHVLWSEDNDQFLNYTFVNTNLELGTFTSMLRFTKGGNCQLYGGSVIGITSGTFFKLEGTAHAYGVERFLADGVRFERRTTSVKLIESAWGNGNITFRSCDDSANQSVGSFIAATFDQGSNAGPIVRWEDCRLAGQHEYAFGANAWQSRGRVVYDGSSNVHHDDPHDMIVMTGATNPGGRPLIRFRNCRGTDATHLWDCDLNWQNAMRGVLDRKLVSVKEAGGRNPFTSNFVEVVLPLNAVVTGARITFPAFGTSTQTAWQLSFETTEGTPTVLLSLAPGTQLKNGADSGWTALWFVCDSDVKRTIRLKANASVDQATTTFVGLIEYVG